ncbi:LacI family DNA-binding transcriptional regulator [Gracilibacillus timonensis]|uniref:LacI family DNA-binding transcriptional regulator n=1 Tax=Gracilibacillus timonensis TaxID=1816696 RepID=UPI000AF7118B|nr:LacI family DNA-binding transcriptional regulator [Gracilibacillus timonensis]
MMNVTIKDIAKQANVSYSTVSKALNDSPLVKEITKQKILRTAEQMGYKPNLAAKQLVRKKTDVVGLIWPTIERIVLATLVTNISQAFAATRYSMILSVDPLEVAKETFKKFQVDGMILFAESEHTIPEDDIPLVAYGVEKKNSVSYPVIDANHEQAMQEAVHYLYQLGHRDIAYIGHVKTSDTLQLEKTAGYRKAMTSMQLQPTCIDTQGLDWVNGYTAVNRFEKWKKPPTAIIGGSYDISGGILRALQEKDMQVPEKVSLISYDNIPQMETMEVPMTCIGVPVDVLAEEIVEAIIQRIESDQPIKTPVLHPELVERNSTAAVR